MSTVCHNCRHPEFLGVECAWPAPGCSATAAPRRRPVVSWLVRTVAAASLLVALLQFGQAGYIQAKAWLAQALIAQAWQKTLAGQTQVKPWPWADTWPVARLRVPSRGVELYVLAGSEGRSLAFGPGHVFGTAQPGAAGNSVIGGHRDTHFAFLQWVQAGETVEVEMPTGAVAVYRISDQRVVDKSDTGVMASPPDSHRLTLVTCYPFDALRAGGPLRYVVTAEEAGTPL
ncbi:class GN sortase [Denitromonas iodatirespirans]|uniref:Class GN sortase n=1 Tax=Denitromonas iodatirespirans TaxID=2795389 RepID=A0A944DR61_DENI1|nr:class GN sortase [Denitromonas iodatirespirans]MBT0963079.1 class GN sortase [Denitromonas iodatirespirans]